MQGKLHYTNAFNDTKSSIRCWNQRHLQKEKLILLFQILSKLNFEKKFIELHISTYILYAAMVLYNKCRSLRNEKKKGCFETMKT